MIASEPLALLAVVGALGVGVVSPGPSFVMIARTSVAGSRAEGLAASVGMGLGGLVFGAAALAGLHAVFTAVPALFLVLKLAGGAWLAWLGWRIFRAARQPLSVDGVDAGSAPGPVGRGRQLRAFWLGLSTQVSNPKTAIVYASVFAALLPATYSAGFAAMLLAAVFAVETLWYAFVAWGLSSAGPRAVYLGWKTLLDRTAGGVMMALGLRLMLGAKD